MTMTVAMFLNFNWSTSLSGMVTPILRSRLTIVWIAGGSPGREGLRVLSDAVSGRVVALAILVVLGIWALRILRLANGLAV